MPPCRAAQLRSFQDSKWFQHVLMLDSWCLKQLSCTSALAATGTPSSWEQQQQLQVGWGLGVGEGGRLVRGPISRPKSTVTRLLLVNGNKHLPYNSVYCLAC